jgi:nucleoside-diphosphate-sugar epimerase
MGLSFTLQIPAAANARRKRRKVLITGAAGRIGSDLARRFHRRYDLRLMVRNNEKNLARLEKFGKVVTAELADLARLKQVCRGIDTVIHLAANPDPMAVWSDLLEPNIVGVYNILVAAKSAGCRRVILASSVHAVTGYPVDVQVKAADPVNPGDLYGVTKCFAEALGRYMAEREGLSVIALRIGAYWTRAAAATNGSLQVMEQWVSPRDLQQLIERCIETENLRWALFHALSGNRFNKLDLTEARELLGYAPQDDITRINPMLKKLDLRKHVRAGNASDFDYRSGLRDDVQQRTPI